MRPGYIERRRSVSAASLLPVEIVTMVDVDESWMFTVQAVDPGGTSGWAIMGIHPDAMGPDPEYRVMENVLFWSCGEFVGPERQQVQQIVAFNDAWPGAKFVLEDFELRPNAPTRSRELLSPVRIGATVAYVLEGRPTGCPNCKRMCDLHARPVRTETPIIWQMPSLALTSFPDDRLRAMGFWVPGPDHKRDALKHCLTYLKRTKDRRVKEAVR